MAWVAIVNPASGLPGAALRCGQMLARCGLVDRLLVGAGPGESALLAREHAGADGIAVVGGDGTILEVVSGLATTPRPIAVFPVGHGNCLARDLGATTVARALTILREGRSRAIDLMDLRITSSSGTVRTLRAVSTVSVGYVADVVAFGRRRLAFLGSAAYGVASTLTRPRRLDLSLAIDGVTTLQTRRTGVVVNNAAHLGNFRAFPQATLTDGLIEVMDMDHGWAMQMAHNACVLMGSRRVGPARMAQARSVHIAAASAQSLMVDGEIFDDVVDVHVSSSPAALACLSAAFR